MKEKDILRILVVDPDTHTRELLASVLDTQPTLLVTAQHTAEALDKVQEGNFDLLITELQLPDGSGRQLLNGVLQLQPDLPVIMVSAFGGVQDAVIAMQDGAVDFMSKPFTAEQAQLAIKRALANHRLVQENHDLREALDDRLRLDNMIAGSPNMQSILKSMKSVAVARTTVLITGESGTGKTLLARAMHKLSPRRDGPFVEVNCGALPETLLESELFGHVRGAFTGAVKDRQGKFEAADCGTIFLDEIGTSSLSFQVKLLRVLQDRIIERLGETASIDVDVRVILATNIDLQDAVAQGNFREDLLYRIQVVNLEMPPLRERQDDIPILAEHFLQRFAKEMEKDVRGIDQEAMGILLQAPWPGNVRQLENIMERAVVLTESKIILATDLPPGLLGQQMPRATDLLLCQNDHLLPLKVGLEGPEKLLIERALAHHNGNRKMTAESLGINRSTLFNKMRKFDLL